MKIEKPQNESYSATVVRIGEVNAIPNADRIVTTTILGFNTIVSVDTEPGEVGIFFTPETQISEEFARKNNLHRHGNLNQDEGSSGFLDDNRRVRTVRLKGVPSLGLFMPLSSLSYIKGYKPSDLKLNDVFDKLGEHEICNKYVIKTKRTQNRVDKNKEKFTRIDKKFLPEHYDSDQWYRHSDAVSEETMVIVTQKLHGTSIRIGNTVVARKHNKRDKLAALVGASIKDYEYDYVFGSRHVIKDINNPNQNHFYTTDIYTEEGEKLKGLVPEGFLLYGELLGWTPDGGPIQRNYTYRIPVDSTELYIYRVAFVNPQGLVVDLSWDQTVEFCQDRGIRTVPELWRGKKKDFVVDDFIDKRFFDDGYLQAVMLDPQSPVDEGVCIRVDSIAPYILKAKGPLFYEHETKMTDIEAEDLEAEESL